MFSCKDSPGGFHRELIMSPRQGRDGMGRWLSYPFPHLLALCPSIGKGARALLSGNYLEVSLALDLGRNPLSFGVKDGLPMPHTETLL